MWAQILTIGWAQFRTTRNHLPRTTLGSVFMGILVFLWYGMFAALGVVFAMAASVIPVAVLRGNLAIGLLAAFLFWQWMPLLSLSGGWSLQLNKLLVYPISSNAFFAIESVLRLTTSPEMVLLVIGATIGLMRNREIPAWAAICLLLYIPLNLFISLSVRELLIHSFERNRYRELFAILLVSVGVLPQLFIRTNLGTQSKPYLMGIANGRGTAWHELAMLSTGGLSLESVLVTALWLGGAFLMARWQFEKGLSGEESLRPAASATHPRRSGLLAANVLNLPSRLFLDPKGALIEKEIRSLLRMPRFRVIFGMACFFSMAVFFPLAFGRASSRFIETNFLPVVNLYGLLLLGDSLLWNIFGFDRSAAQVYFVTPLTLKEVVQAKNLTAVLFMILQSVVVFLVAIAFRFPVTFMNLLTAVSASAVVGIFFLSVGNLSSVIVPRPIDPSQTLRKQSGAQIQLWLLGCSVGMFVLVGFAFLARWALDSDWALIGVLAVEFCIGLIVYRISIDSAVQRGIRDRERILQALSKSASPVSV
jgi:ABC-2 type transport system permease protein